MIRKIISMAFNKRIQKKILAIHILNVLALTLQAQIKNHLEVDSITSALKSQIYFQNLNNIATDHWITIRDHEGDVSMTNDNRYFSYVIANLPYKSFTRVLQATKDSWKQEFVRMPKGFFSTDSKYYIVQLSDSLVFYPLGGGTPFLYRNGIINYQRPENRQSPWIGWTLKNESGVLVLHNLYKLSERRFSGVIGFKFDPEGKVLIMLRLIKEVKSILWYNILSKKESVVWSTKDDDTSWGGSTLDSSANQLAFRLQKKNGNTIENSIWYYKPGMVKAIMLANNQSKGIEKGLTIQGVPEFIEGDKYLMFTLNSEKDLQKKIEDSITSYKAFINIESRQIIRVEREE